MRRGRLPLSAALVAGAAAACGATGDPASPGEAPRAGAASAPAAFDALDPASCAGCHADHARAWSGSMHAYASDDPVFVAMNARGQRESGGALGAFCVRCHAPVAFALGATKDGTDLARLPAKLRGVTCFACHAVDAVTGAHDGALHLAEDGALRGAIADPAPAPHASVYSPLHDRARIESAATCGACHDVRTPAGVDAERTYAEWQSTAFAHGDAGEVKACGGCHMPETSGPAALGGATRRVHDHTMAALDVALGDFPEKYAQRKAVQAALDPALGARLCVTPGAGGVAIDAELANARIGHAWPTGAAHDRRAWLELTAYAGGAVVWSSGASPEDPGALLLRSTLLDARGAPATFLWQAAGVRADVLAPGGGTRATHVALAADAGRVDRVTMRARVTPLGRDVVDALVASGDLDPALGARVPVYTLGSTALEWTADRGAACLP